MPRATVYDEPLLESAALAARLAPGLCARDAATGESCAWNHGFWQFLRALELVTTPAHHGAFFHDAVGFLDVQSAPPRVLISGAADYAMLVQVLKAFAARSVTPGVTVIDICDTPLALNAWYAERARLAIETARADVLEYRSDTPYDLVCSHAFLGQFAPSGRGRLLAQWRELLRPGGLAVTVNRIRPDGGAGRTGFTPVQAQAFVSAVMRNAAALGERLPIALDELARVAAEYAARQSGYSVRRREEVLELFAGAGFELEHLSFAALEAGAGTPLSGPTTPGGAEFACIVARKPR